MPEAPPKKINADSFKRGLSLEEKVESNSEKITLVKDIINFRKENVDRRLEEIEGDVDNIDSDLMDGLHLITESLVGVKAILADQVKERINQRKADRRENARLRKKRREDELESKKERGEGPLSGVVGVAKDIFGRLKKFLTNILLGAAIINLFKWLKDPKNLDNLKNFAKFLQDHGLKIIGTLAALAAVNFIGGLLGIGGALKGILGLVGVKGFLIAASVAAAAATAILIKNEAQKYMDEEYGPDLMGRESYNPTQKNIQDTVAEIGKEETIKLLELEKRRYLAENPGDRGFRRFIGWTQRQDEELDRGIEAIKSGEYDKFDPTEMDPKDLALLEQVKPQFEDARSAWKSFVNKAKKIDFLYSPKGIEGKTTEQVLNEVVKLEQGQEIDKDVLVKSLKNIKTLKKAMSNDGQNSFNALIARGTGVSHAQLFAKNWEKEIKVGAIQATNKKRFAYLNDVLLGPGGIQTQKNINRHIDRAKAAGVESGLKVDKKGETLDTEKEKFLPPSNTDIVNESVVKDGREETIAKLREQKKNLNLWERMSGVGGEINEQIYRLETGKEMDQRWKQSYERKVNEGKVGNVLGGFEDRGPKVEPTTKLIDSQSYSSSTNKTISMMDMLTSGDRSQIEEALYMQRVKERGVGEGYSDWVGNPEHEKDTLKWLNNANIDKSNKTSVKGSSGIESVASSKTPKINLLPITGGGQSKIASSSGAMGNQSVVFSSEDPSQTNFAVQGIYNVSQA